MFIIGDGHGDPNLNLDDAVCIFLSANTLGKGLNLTIPSPAMDKY